MYLDRKWQTKILAPVCLPNLQERTVVHEILEMSTQNYTLSPAIKCHYKFLHLPMACNFALVTPSIKFRLPNSVEEITEPHLKVRLSPILFHTFESLLSRLPPMETLQSAGTIKCALDHFVHSVTQHSYNI
jgi:hypothetical protein